MKKILFYLLFCVLSLKFEVFPVFAQVIDPQYIFVRKNPMNAVPPNGSQLWNMNNPSLDYYPGIVDVYNIIGSHGNNQRKLGIGVLVYYNEYNFENIKASLPHLLQASKDHTFPIFLSLDGFQWWSQRSDLYNNSSNVEKTASLISLTESWRTWGEEKKIAPHPNLASRAFIEANKARQSELVSIIAAWYNNLPAEKKWLFGGISLGTEVDIGGNYYYPGGGIANSQQLGFAAVNTLGLSGGINTINLNEIVRRYINELDKSAFDGGIPRNKIFNHVGGSDLFPRPNNLVAQTAQAAVSTYGNPGWTFYNEITYNLNFNGLNTALNQTNSGSYNAEWASPEWLTSAGDYTGWVTSLKNSLNYRNNRFINIANWEEIRNLCKKDLNENCTDDGTGHIYYARDAIRDVANESPACWVTTPQLNISVNGNTATFNWIKGANNDSIHLNVSNTEGFTVSGTLANPNVIVENNTTKTSYTKSGLGAGKYYVILVADGCGNQRKIADGRFVIAAAPTAVPPTSVPPTKIPTVVPTTKPKITGDYDGDGVVNLADFGEWKKRYLAVPPTMTLADFGVWKKAYLGN